NVAGSGPAWLFDIDNLTKTMNYQPITIGNQSNPCAGFQDKFDAEKAEEEIDQQYVLFPVWSSDITYSDDEVDVGEEADFNNLETSITEKHLQFKMQKVLILVDLPHGKRAIGFEDPNHPNKVYKVVKELYGLHQAPRAWYETLANYLLEDGFQKGKIDQTLFIKRKKVKQKKDGIFISQDKYVAEILRKFGLSEEKLASTPIDTEKPLLKDPDGEDVDVHTYRSMIGSLMYLTSSRPDIMYAVCACAHF
nr:hypothetical protein [Tanacetum cinerariifolium]